MHNSNYFQSRAWCDEATRQQRNAKSDAGEYGTFATEVNMLYTFGKQDFLAFFEREKMGDQRKEEYRKMKRETEQKTVKWNTMQIVIEWCDKHWNDELNAEW